MSTWQSLAIRIGDQLLGWTLSLPRDLTLLVIACLTVVVLLAIRFFTADRAALTQLSADERRLQELRQQAGEVGDAEALHRQRTVRRLLAARRVRLEWLPAVVGLLPTLLILSWGARRLEYLPLRSRQPFEFTATLPRSAIGGHAHIVPQPDWDAEDGWIRPVEPTPSEARGIAVWKLRPSTRGESTIAVRHPDGSVEHPVDVGLSTYRPPIVEHGPDVSTQVLLTHYRPFGVVPGIAWLGLPAWSFGLLLLAVPMYLAVKRLLRLP